MIASAMRLLVGKIMCLLLIKIFISKLTSGGPFPVR